MPEKNIGSPAQDPPYIARIREDHYQVPGERRTHHRALDSDFWSEVDVPHTTDFECASCSQAWPCDTAIVLGEAS